MSDDRLKALLHQKELLKEHLEWIEKEIAQEKGSTEFIPQIPSNRLASEESLNKPVAEIPEEPNQKAAVPDIYDELGPDTKSSVNSARTGCIAMFAVGFLILAAIVWLVYYIY